MYRESMRRFFLMLFLLGAYLWAITSGHDQFFLAQGKAVAQWVIHWFEDAEADFQLERTKSPERKKSRRWN
jgi:hypothetical protein